MRHLLNRPRALLAAAGLGAALCVAPAIQAGAATESTFVVLYREGSSSSNAASTIASAGGTVVANYGQIGVLVARSSNSGFASALKQNGNVEGIAATTGLGVGVKAGR